MYLQSGTLLQGGKYKIVRFIKSGGFGCTYEAWNTVFEERVAIKEFFPKDFCNREDDTLHVTVGTQSKKPLVSKLRKKFIDEAKAIRKLPHPGIVTVSDVFEENGTAYYVMDYIDGCSLDEIVKRDGALPEQTVLEYIRQVCLALGYVHSQNRLHLDIKPGNIMVDSSGRTILIDFGTSRQYDEVNGENTSTLLPLTPGYASTEQYRCDGMAQFTPVTDVYSLGATLYKLLTGVTPVDAPSRASGESLAPLPSCVSQSVSSAVQSAMSLDMAMRPQSVEEFLFLLDADSEGTVVPPPQPPPPPPKKSFLKWFLGMVAGLVAATVLYFVIDNRPDIPEHKEVALTDTTITTPPLPELNDSELVQPSDSSAALEEERLNIVDRKELPNIAYSLSDTTGGYSEDSRLCATIDGEEVVIGSISYIFGPYNMGYMKIFDQQDYNGDGIRDVMVCDVNLGNGGGSTWAVITYAGDNTFEKSNLISEASYYKKEISYVNGQAVLDFITIDMGERIVKERYGLKNGNLVLLDLPKSKSQAYSILKSVNMEALGEHGSFYFDLNDDGISEKVTTTGPGHFGRSFVFNMNGQDYQFYVSNAMWGVGTLHILKTKTNGFHDIMVEQDTRLVHKWDGSTYKWE